MTNTRYLIAKYIPDLRRVEPRNVGVVVWSTCGVAGRFLAEKPGRPGEVDGRSIPPFVTSFDAYKQWIEFWQTQLQRPELTALDGAQRASRNSEQFLDVLQSYGKGNFVLADGGIVLDRVCEDDVGDLLDHLFYLLVDAGSPEEPRDPTLDELCEGVIEKTRARENPNFRIGYEVTCKVSGDTEERFEFSYALANGTPQRLYQRVPLSRKRTLLRKTIHDSAWMFEKVLGASLIKAEHAVALVNTSDEQLAEPEVGKLLKVLASVARIVNVADEHEATQEFAQLPSLSGHP